MAEKRWANWFLVAFFATVLLFAAVMYVTDPLLQYGTESPLFTYYEYSEIYSNPGIAQHYKYDAVMVGTSMIENTDVQECNELFGCDMVRLPYSGGTTYNMKTILDICFQSDNTIKTVYWELDEYQLFASSTEPKSPLPEYLYRNDHLEDASYLLNLDIFYHYTVNNALGTLKGKVQPAAREADTWDGTFGKESVLASVARPAVSQTQQQFADAKAQIDGNLNNITTLVAAHPDTEFVFFMVPFSVIYWDHSLRNGEFDSHMDAVLYAMETLLEYDNVRLYFYQNETDIITNLDNYKDYSHYGKWINSFMTQSMAKGHGRVTKDNYRQIIENMREFVYSYDYESIYQGH